MSDKIPLYCNVVPARDEY